MVSIERLGTFLVAPGQYVTEWRECQVRADHADAARWIMKRRALDAERGRPTEYRIKRSF